MTLAINKSFVLEVLRKSYIYLRIGKRDWFISL